MTWGNLLATGGAPAGPASLALLAAATAPPALFAAMLAWNLARAPRLERAPAPRERRRVSLLVPARNEADNLPRLLPRLAAQDWPGLEILVLDDASTDGTADAARAVPGVRVIPGRPLPPGWIGKGWACAQLAEAASGDVLLFCDADVLPEPGAVAATVGLLEAHRAGAVTCLPRQLLGTWSERAVIPLVLHLPVLGLLPLPLVPRHPLPDLSLGVGQWFAFTREAYAACGGHATARAALAEDMDLARRVKTAGGVLVAALSDRLLAVRMYRGFADLREGFRKNLVVLTGSGSVRPPLVLALFLLLFAAPWMLGLAAAMGLLPAAWAAPGLLLLAARLAAGAAFREPPSAWLWHPVGSLLVPWLAIESWLGLRRGSLTWKGRVLEAAFAGASRDAVLVPAPAPAPSPVPAAAGKE